ncbi:MAG: hypothetical protein ACE5Q6_03170 [Dehalococcoidia bacterium]
MDAEANVVIITAYPDSDLMSQVLKIGPFTALIKPLDPNALRVVLGKGKNGP